MECPKCLSDNPDARKFCYECGAKLLRLCPQCGCENLARDKFCGECGQKLTPLSEPSRQEPSLDEKIAKIQRYLPRGLTEKILSQRDRIEGERKQVTVMFCDMAGFTYLSETLGPEEAYSIMDQVYEILIHKVHDYEGTVNEMTGDGIMALFGAPIAVEDAPQRAIRSAYAIHREMSGFGDRIKQDNQAIPPLKMRIGIHTGPVVVGTLGNDLRVEFKAVGDTVNLASRVEGLAEPGATCVTAETFRLTEGLFRFEALGKKQIKGKAAPVEIYRVIAPSTRKTRFDVSAERGLTPFVGRERELELLLDGFERAKAGRGQAFSITSEAGLGKSRLLYEFRKAVANETLTFLEGKCLSYSRGVAFHPVIDILKANFDIREGDQDGVIRQKVKRGLEVLEAAEASTLPCFLELLSVRDSGIDDTLMNPEAIKAQIIAALNRIVLRGSEIRPLIMAFEDLHWVDKSSEESIKSLLDSISGARVFLIFTYRPEFVTWGGRSYHSQVNLNRLSNRESLAMAAHLLGTQNISKDLAELVLEKTEGIPFYIEEFIKSLRDLGIIKQKGDIVGITKKNQTVAIPAKIQDVIMARVDTLPEEAKRLLQTGAVAGREFGHDLIKALTDLPQEDLLSQLSVLKDSELLYERGIYPQSTYVFKHALTQEVAYNSLILKRRKKIHRQIALAIEELYPESLEEHCELLAYHCLQGEDWQPAYRYSREAGLKAFSLSAYQEAQSYFEAALKALHRLPPSRDRIEKEIDLSFNMRAALFPQARHEAWGKLLRDSERLARQINDDARLANVLNYLSNFHWVYGECLQAIDLGTKGLGLARKIGDFSCQVATIFHLGFYFHTLGDFAKHVELHQELLRLLAGEDALRRHGLTNVPAATTRSALVLALAELGNFNKIEILGRQAVGIAEKVKDAFTMVLVLDFLAMAYLRLGKVETALRLLEKSHDHCRCYGVQTFYAYTAGCLGYAHLLSNEPARALTILEEGTREENIKAAAFWTAHPLTILAEARRVSGKPESAHEAVSRALKIAGSRQERALEGWALPVMAEVDADLGRPEQALDWYRRGLSQAAELSMRPLTAHCHLGLGQLFLGTGQSAEACNQIKAALDLYRSMDMKFWLPQAEAALAKCNRTV